MRGRRGSVMAFCYLITALLMAYGSLLLARSLTDQRVAHRQRDQLHAFQVAEAGVDEAFHQLRNDFNATVIPTVSLGTNQSYQVTIIQDGDIRTIRSTGTNSEESISSKQVEVKVQRSIPANFYDNAIYGSSAITLSGNAYAVTGNLLTGSSELLKNFKNVNGKIIYDASAKPLPKLSFAQLQSLAVSQGNVYDEARLNGIKKGTDHFPASFCYSPPTDPNDLSTCTPNINYLKSDLVLNGNVGTIGGFFVVVGNVLTDPSTTEDATINGNGKVDGMIYTTGQFTVNGGGGGLNVVGGVWAGKEAKVNGNVTIEYDAAYMQAVKNLGVSGDLRVLYWNDCPPSGCS